MPTNPMFKTEEGRAKLLNILLAYSRWDPKVGYVQGMNFIVANLLLHTNEENAFILLVRMMQDRKYNCRDFFEPDLRRYRAVGPMMDALIKRYIPDLHAHFEKIGVDSRHFTQEFVTLYTYTSNMPRDVLNQIWDMFFLSGWSILFRVWVGVLESEKAVLLKMGLEECIGYLHTLHKDKERLSEGERKLVLTTDILDRAIDSPISEIEIAQLERDFDASLRSV